MSTPARPMLATVALVAAVGALAVAPSASATTNVTLHLTGTITSYWADPMGSGQAQHPGDESFFVTTLTGTDGSTGTAPHHCIAVDQNRSLCTAQVELAGGQLSLQTLISPANSPTLRVPVTGGTGLYEGASGEADLVATGPTTQDWTINLILR